MTVRALAVFPILVSSAVAGAGPGWTDVPALVSSATQPIAGELRSCMTTLHPIGIVATRTAKGTRVTMPTPHVGDRGFTTEERCLLGVIAKIRLPELPIELASVDLALTVDPPPADLAFDAWRDPAATIGALFDAKQRAAFAACSSKPRVIQLVLDRVRSKTRVWLPAWQFHSPTGDGSTPAAELPIKACLTRAIGAVHPLPLPQAMAELHVALRADR